MKKLSIVILLAIVFITFYSSFVSAEDELEEDPFEPDRVECESNDDVFHRHKSIQTHLQFYYELLIDKYTPELKKEWKEVISEREVILKKMKEMKKEGIDIDYSAINDEWKEKHQEYHEAFLEAVKKRDGEKIKDLLPILLDLQKKWNEEQKLIFKSDD